MRANFVLSGVATGIRRNLTMTIALVLSTAIALSFVGAALLASKEITKFRNTYENNLNVSIYLCSSLPPRPASCTGPSTADQIASIRSTLQSDPTVRAETFHTEQQALDIYAKQHPDIAKFVKLGYLPATFTVKLSNLSKDYPAFQAKYSKVPGVGQVSNQIDTIKALLNIIESARWFSIVVALIVLVASMLLMANTIQVAAEQRRAETSIMRLVGASRWMTELPFMLEAVFASAIGGLIAMVSIWIGKHYVLDSVFSGPTKHGVIPNLGINDVLVSGGIGLLIGVILSAVTAFATLRFYVRL
jgi:cell division transport system permease protein